MHTLSRNMPRPGSQSPPLPPPPPPEESEHSDFGRPRSSAQGSGGGGGGPMQPIVPEDQNLPGWVPKNYIEKGENGGFVRKLNLFWQFCFYFQLSPSTITMRTRMMSWVSRRAPCCTYWRRMTMAGGRELWMVLQDYSLEITWSRAFKGKKEMRIRWSGEEEPKEEVCMK